MGQAEYIVRFKGDYSALQKDINKIAGETKKLSDDEVIIKLAYDGNIKEFNKVFNQISEMHPELGIQFQYNVNQKILEQETDKLKKLTDIKIDVDENKAQEKLENLADYVETALMDGLSKDEINKRVRDVFGYYNTAIKAGAKNIDFGSIRNRLLDLFSIESDEIADIYAEIADRNINKPIELFKINASINDEITKTTDRINDLQESLKYLEGKGASKTGLPTELEKVQDEIKILRADVDEMKQDLNSLTGEAFDKMTESIKETNVQLSEAIDKIKILSVAGVSDDKVSSLKTLMSLFSDFAKSNNGNNLSSFWDNLQVKINSGDDELKTLLSDLKLINAETGKLNIIEHGNVKSGGLLSDEYTLLATKRATQDTDFTVSSRLEDTIVLKQKLDEAADAGVNVSRILNIIYDEASDTFFELQETAKGDILGGMGEAEINTKVFEATDEQIQKLISDILYLNNIGVGIDVHGLNVLYDKIKGFSIIDTDIVPGYNFKDNWEDFTNDIIGGLNFSFEDSSGKMSEEAQGFVKRVQDVLVNIDTSEIKGSAKKVVENAANALQEAQNESSSAELTKPLGKDFGLGYAEGIREAMPEIVEACKEIVLAAYDAVKEASDAKNGEGNNFLDNFINNLKESLDNAAPTIQGKIKEVFSKIDIDNKSEESSLSSITSEDFKSQFQNAIDETGKYIIKVYGELIDDFKSRLQNSIDETGIYHVDIEGWLYNTFHDGLQRDIDGQEKYIIEVKGRLFNTFKEVLQEAIENLGTFPIEVKPYMRKGGEIEEVDLPGGKKKNQNNLNKNNFEDGDKISLTGYHGSGKKWIGESFDFGKTKASQLGSAMYFVDSPEKLKGFLSRPGAGDIKQTELNLEKCFILTQNYISSISDINKILGTTFDEFSEPNDILTVIRNYNKASKENSDNFRKSMLNMGYQGMYVGDYLANKKVKDELAVYDESLIQNLTSIPKAEFQSIIDGATEASAAIIKYSHSVKEASNQNNLSSEGTTTPSQQFNNEVQQNLVMLENYENTIKEIDKLKVDPETDEAKHKIQELNKLADYFASQITVIRSENGHEVNRSMMYFNGVPNNNLMKNYSMDDIKRFTRVADERTGLNRDTVFNEFVGVEEELSRIEHASEGLRNALTKNLSDSKTYVSRVRADLLNLVETYKELEHVKEGSRDYELYQKDIKVFSERTPEVLQFLDKIKTYDQAYEFVKTDEWKDFLATLPQAHTYLESIGYDFDKINRVSNETPVSTESTEAETKALLSKKEVVEQLRTELNLTKKAAEDLFDQQGYAKTNSKYQLEQTAVDELIASLKEKKQVEESQDSSTTSSTANAMQSEVETVNQAIDAEKKKFDELKNEISKTIPTAINKKNQAFEKERDLVAKVVDDEVDYFDVLKDSINSVTNTIEKQYDTTKNAKPKADKSNNKSSNNKSSSNKSNEPDKDALLQQHYVDLRKDAYQSFGQKSDIQKEMSKYYSQLEKESSDIYSSANKKANGLLDKIKKLNFDKYTQDFVDELKSAESELTDFLNQLKAGVVPLDEIDNRISVLATNIEDTLSKKALGNVKKAGEKTLSNIALKIDQIIAKNSAMGKQYEDRFKGLRKELEEAENVDVAKRIIADVNQLESEIINAGKTGVSFIDQIKQRLRDMNSKYIAQYFSFQDIIRYARQAVTNVVQLNDAFIELSKVSNTSLEDLESDFQSYANTAKDIGGTITDTISATADWSRLGYNVPDSKELAEVAMLYKNVGDGIDINTANESLISTLRGFKMEADDAISVVDKFNEVSNNFAISSGGIGESLQRSAAAFSAANTDLSQSIALITATNEIVQDPDAVGSMWTTVSARIRGAKSELEDMGEDTEDMVESTSKLRDLVKGITGVDIMLDENTFKDIYTIITQIGDKWNEISDIDQAALLEALAGKRQANRLAAVLGNLDHLKEAYQTAEESAGSARREQENFEKGITYSINQAKATLEELSYDAINSDFLKGLVNTGTKLLEIIDKIIDKFGLFKSLIIGGATVLGSQKLG